MDSIPNRLKGLSRDDWTTYREAAARYEAACSGTVEPPTINDFLPSHGHQPLRSLLLIHLIKEEYERRHDRDEAVAMAPYLERFPELRDDPQALQELQSWERTLTGSRDGDTDSMAPPSLPAGYRFLRELRAGA